MSNTTTIYTTYQTDGSPVVAIQDKGTGKVAFAGVTNKANFSTSVLPTDSRS